MRPGNITPYAIGSHLLAGPVLDSAIALEALALGYVAAPLVGGALSTVEGAIVMNAPVLPHAVDFVSGMLPGMPENKWQLRGYILTEGLKYLEETRQYLQRGHIDYNPDEYDGI